MFLPSLMILRKGCACLWRISLTNHTQAFPCRVWKSTFFFSTELLQRSLHLNGLCRYGIQFIHSMYKEPFWYIRLCSWTCHRKLMSLFS